MKKHILLTCTFGLFVTLAVPTFAEVKRANASHRVIGGKSGVTRNASYTGRIRRYRDATAVVDYLKLPVGEVSRTQLALTYGIGTIANAFTSARSASAPATYVDASGVIRVVTTADVGRLRGGYYDGTGFHADKGLMMESSSTNLIRDSYFAAADPETYWSVPYGGTMTKSSDFENPYLGGQVLKFVATEKDQRVWADTTTNKFSVTAGSTYTISFLVRGSGTVYIRFSDGAVQYGSNYTLLDKWSRISYTVTAASSTADGAMSISNAVDSALTLYVACVQVEAKPYMTSWIPTSTASVSRSGEINGYAISGNRTAAEETMVFYFTPMFTNSNDGVTEYLTNTDTKSRRIYNFSTSTAMTTRPNSTDNSAVSVNSVTAEAAGVPIVVAAVFKHSSPYAAIFVNGVKERQYTAGDWTTNAWGTNFYVGSENGTSTSSMCAIKRAVFYSKEKSDADVAKISAEIKK